MNRFLGSHNLYFTNFGSFYAERRIFMSYRSRRSPHADKRAFARTASKTKDINIRPRIMRGGIRL